MNNGSLGKRVSDIAESYINGQRKQMIAQYQDACLAFEAQDVVLVLQLSDELSNDELLKILATLLIHNTTKDLTT